MTDESGSSSSWQEAVGRLGPSNLFLLGSIATLALIEVLNRRLEARAQDQFRQRYEILRGRQRRLLEKSLEVFCDLVSTTLGVRANARYFTAAKDPDGRIFLEQDRDLAILRLPMPREYGFTRVSVNSPHFISGRSFRDRTPIYEELPVDHENLYDAELRRMIEPTQRWVLACPVLALDPGTNSHIAAADPYGVVVFYGIEVPDSTNTVAIANALRYSEEFATAMAHVMSMLRLSTAPGG